MEIYTRKQQQISIIELAGELDAESSVQVDAELIFVLRGQPKQIWIDGKGLKYISSAGLGVFISHFQTLKQKNINLVFFGLNSKIRNVFNILGLEEMIQIVPDKETAEQYFGSI